MDNFQQQNRIYGSTELLIELASTVPGEYLSGLLSTRIIGRAAPAIISGLWVERLKPPFDVKVVNRVRDESLGTVFFDPLVEVLRKEVLLVLVIFNKIVLHRFFLNA
ncbi:MAG: hypothetical protein ABEH88_07185 [Halobacteriales archaeon]